MNNNDGNLFPAITAAVGAKAAPGIPLFLDDESNTSEIGPKTPDAQKLSHLQQSRYCRVWPSLSASEIGARHLSPSRQTTEDALAHSLRPPLSHSDSRKSRSQRRLRWLPLFLALRALSDLPRRLISPATLAGRQPDASSASRLLTHRGQV